MLVSAAFFLLLSNDAIPSVYSPFFASYPVCTDSNKNMSWQISKISWFKSPIKLHPNMTNLFRLVFALEMLEVKEKKKKKSVKATFIPFSVTTQ